MDVQERFLVITDAARQALVSILRDGYAKADDRYDARDGSNSQTYGTDLYHMTWSGLEASKVLEAEGICYQVHKQVKRLIVGDEAIACHRIDDYVPAGLGKDVKAAPAVSLRRARQLGFRFPGREHVPEVPPTCTMLLAHYGNPTDGCLGIYLQVPAAEEEAKAGTWAAAQKLWAPGDNMPRPTDGKKPIVKVEPEIITPAKPRRKPKKRDQA
jgi:hypothetical protein